MTDYLGHLAEVVLDPDEVQANKNAKRMAIFYKRLGTRYYLRAAVLVQPSCGQCHSTSDRSRARHDAAGGYSGC